MFTKAIVRPPASNFSEGLTTAATGVPDYHLALEQHRRYCEALEQCGLELIRLESDEQHPDSCFVEDTAIVIAGPSKEAHNDRDVAGTEQAILTRPGASSRLGEIDVMRGELARLFPALREIRSPGTLDGGDVCEAGEHFFIGISERTNDEGARQLASILTTYGYTSSFVDIRATRGLLHLKSGVAYLHPNRLVVSETLAQREEFRGYDLIRVDSDEDYAANCIQVNDQVLIAKGYPLLEAKLRALGYQTVALNMSEFQKMDGGLSCLSVRW